MRNEEVAGALLEISRLLELDGEDAFRIRAYRKAAENVAALEGDINEYYREGRLRDIPGVGPTISGVIAELLEGGKSGLHEALKEDFPPELQEVLEVPGIGRRTALKIYEALGTRTVDDFRRAARSHRIRQVRGLGERTERRVLDAIERHRRLRGEALILLSKARALAADLMGYFEGCPGLERADVAGSVRRWKPQVADVNLIAAAGDPEGAIGCFCGIPLISSVRGRGRGRARAATRYRVEATLEAVGADDYGLKLLYATGSARHLEDLARYAEARGVRLSPEGYYEKGERKKFPTEECLYGALGLEYIPPELREGSDEVAAASVGGLPELVRADDIRGDMHVHTIWSDGKASIQEMAMAARARGLEYIAICDHSGSLRIANGLSIERLRDQMAAIDEINDTLEGFTVLKGCEADILADGSLDLPKDVLGDLDVVVGSVHTSLRQGEDLMTRRVITALENEHLTVLGHPTNRLLGSRPPLELDLDRAIEAAARHRKALEVNSSPARLDLGGEGVRLAMEHGAMICINTDAHTPEELCHLEYGVHTARRGWATKARTLNALSYDALAEFLARR